MDQKKGKIYQNYDDIESAFNGRADQQKDRYTCGYLQLYPGQMCRYEAAEVPESQGSQQPVVLADEFRNPVSEVAVPGSEYAPSKTSFTRY